MEEWNFIEKNYEDNKYQACLEYNRCFTTSTVAFASSYHVGIRLASPKLKDKLFSNVRTNMLKTYAIVVFGHKK